MSNWRRTNPPVAEWADRIDEHQVTRTWNAEWLWRPTDNVRAMVHRNYYMIVDGDAQYELHCESWYVVDHVTPAHGVVNERQLWEHTDCTTWRADAVDGFADAPSLDDFLQDVTFCAEPPTDEEWADLVPDDLLESAP